MPCMSLLGVMLFLPSHLQVFALLGCFSNAPYEGHYSIFMLFDGPFGIYQSYRATVRLILRTLPQPHNYNVNVPKSIPKTLGLE